MTSSLPVLLSAPMREKLQRLPLSEQIATLQRSRLLAVALDHARRQGCALSPVEQGIWKSLVDTQAPVFERDNALLARMQAALDERGCPALLLKGAALGRWLYAQPALRPVTDLDIIVPAAKRLDAHRAFVELGFSSDGYSQHDLIANQARYRDAASGRDVDLHWSLHVLPELACRFDFDELMARSIALPGPLTLRALGRVDALMHAAIHFQAHQPTDDRPAVWLYDLALLARGMTAADWTTLDHAVRDKQLAGLLAEALLQARQWFDVELPADLVGAWQALGRRECSRNLIGASQGHVARVRRSLACLPSMRQRLAYLLACLFPARDWMRGRYAATTTAQLLRAYLKRWLAGAKESVLPPMRSSGTVGHSPAWPGHR